MPLPESFAPEKFFADPSHRLLDATAAEAVATACRAAARDAVWIEGFSQSGKTCFADVVGQHLGWRVVHLDQLASQITHAAYAAVIDRSELQRKLGTVELRRQVVIEGICLRDVVGTLADRQSALTVYVMRVGNPAAQFLWYDASEFNADKTRLNWVDANAHDYHRRVHPEADADLTFARIE